MNTSVLETKTLKMRVKTLATLTQQAISNYQTELVELTFENGRCPTVDIPRYIHVSGCTGLQGQVNGEKCSRTSTYSKLVASKLVAATHAFSSLGVA